jgi:5-methylcytosine-specific restriction enzyme A
MPPRNPAWSTDELALALDLYVREGQLDDRDERVIQLSQVLNALPLDDTPVAENFRNANGVAMKLANFARLDPAYPGTGLTRGGRRDEEVWTRFHDDPDELHPDRAGIARCRRRHRSAPAADAR